MTKPIRVIGIAFGSFVIAYLAVSLVAGAVFGQAATNSPLLGVAIVAFGGLVFVDIVRRDRARLRS
jgi:hypothetical protein